MYLHDVADPEASFTKVDMTNNKHQEYEQSLMDDFKSGFFSRILPFQV